MSTSSRVVAPFILKVIFVGEERNVTITFPTDSVRKPMRYLKTTSDNDVQAYLLQHNFKIPETHAESIDHCRKACYGYEFICMDCHTWGCDHCHLTLVCDYCGYMSCNNQHDTCNADGCWGVCGTSHRNDWCECSTCGRTDSDLPWNYVGNGCVACGKYKCGHDDCIVKRQ